MTARAIADVEEGIILASVEIAAPCERVFRALTESSDVVQWWGSSDTYKTTSWTSDLRVGGAWRAEGRSHDGRDFVVQGDYLEVDPPHRLVLSWQANWDDGNRTTVTYRLDPTEIGGLWGTRLTLTHRGFAGRPEACNGHGQGWQRVFGWLRDFLQPKAPERLFVTRLIPPRPSFAFDMSAEEREMMEAHIRYWRGPLQQGRVVVLGPVNDAVGAYGLGVVRAVDEADLEQLLNADPAIMAQRGMRYESAPMLSAMLPGSF